MAHLERHYNNLYTADREGAGDHGGRQGQNPVLGHPKASADQHLPPKRYEHRQNASAAHLSENTVYILSQGIFSVLYVIIKRNYYIAIKIIYSFSRWGSSSPARPTAHLAVSALPAFSTVVYTPGSIIAP